MSGRRRADRAAASEEPPASVLVVGDLMCDHYIHGDVERVSPEAPVQVLRWDRELDRAGGAANVALNLAALGCQVSVAGIVGADGPGRWLLRTMKRRGIDTGSVVISRQRATTRKIRVVARGQHLLRIDQEEQRPIDRPDEKTLVAQVRKKLREVSAVVCSDYEKGVLSDSVLRAVLGQAGRAARRVPVLVDPKRIDFAAYRGAQVLTPNEQELVAATQDVTVAAGHGEDDLGSRARHIRSRTGADALLVTRGEHGMELFEFQHRPPRRTHLPAFQSREVYDVTGAGDTVTAVMALGMSRGAPLPEVARLATIAAGIVVSNVGTGVVDAETLERVSRGAASPSSSKVIGAKTLRDRLDRARAAGARVVFTNGCFDLLHAGHLHLLERARALGDLLVVGINDDRSVQRLKGLGRPLTSQGDRAELLSALRCVDYVTVFKESTPLRLIKVVKPDVLVKGADYALDEVVGRDVVEQYGGRVERVPLLAGFSTTDLITTLRQSDPQDRAASRISRGRGPR